MTDQEIRLEIIRLALDQAQTAYGSAQSSAQIKLDKGQEYVEPADNRTRDTIRAAKKYIAFIEGRSLPEVAGATEAPEAQ